MSPSSAPDYGYASTAGPRRNLNEDAVAVPDSVDPALLSTRGWLFALADGVSGYLGAQEAATTAVNTAMETYYQDPVTDPTVALERSVQAANSRIFQRVTAMPDAGLRTTLTLALLQGNNLIVAAVGDSRAYVYQSHQLRQITADHKWVNEQVQSGLISESDAAGHPFSHILTRSLGEKEQLQVDTFHVAIRGGQTILLCTDGLYNSVPASAIERILSEAPSAMAAAHQLVDLAAEAQTGDDISAVVIRPGGRGPLLPGLGALLAKPTLTLPQTLGLIAGVIVLVILIRVAWGALAPGTPASPGPNGTATPTARALLPTTAPTSAPTVAPTAAPTQPATVTPAPTVAPTKPAGTPAPPAATPKAGRPALPAAGAISTVRWGFASSYFYAQLPTDQVHGSPAGELLDGAKVQVLDAQIGWNVYANETDGNVWYKISYKDASGQEKIAYVPSSAVAFSQ